VGHWVGQADVQSALQGAMPLADRFVALDSQLYEAVIQEGEESQTVQLVSLGSGQGYAGPIRTAVVWTSDLEIGRVVVWQQSETKAFYRRLNVPSLLEIWEGKRCTDPYQVGQDIQAVTGATVSLQGLSESIRRAGRIVADHAGVPVTEATRVPVRVGLPETLLVLLYGVGFMAFLPGPRTRRIIRRLCLVVGLIGLGWWLNRPVSLVQINAMLLGYWPQWQSHLYWYLLIGGVLLPVLLTGRSVYCSHVCPMGTVQEVLRIARGKQISMSPRITAWLRRFQRSLTFVVVIVALVTRNPGVAQYEITGTLFGLTGALWQFGLLALALIGSLFLVRPWCLMLCPIRAVSDFLRLVRRMVRGSSCSSTPSQQQAIDESSEKHTQ